MATIIDGKALSEQILKEAGEEVLKLKQRGITPGLAAVLVGENPASQVYVRNKTKSCEQIGMFAETIRMPKESTQEAVVQKVRELNRDPRFHGILVQLPLPSHIDEGTVVNTVAPEKDADGLTAASMGKLALGEPFFIPATAAGIQQLLIRTGHDPEGKHVVICGRSNIVSKPLALLLVQKAKGANATVTMCHTRTRDIASFTRQADILIVSTGVAQWVKEEMVKPGVVVIDVGINRINDPTTKSGTRLVGDVDFTNVSKKAAAITPVPGGVGPMTVAMLVASTAKAAAQSLKGT